MDQPRPRVSVLCFSKLEGDARVLRQIRRLSQHFEVTAIGYGRAGTQLTEGVTLCPVPEPAGFVRRNLTAIPKLIAGRVASELGYDRWYWDRADHRAALDALVASRPDLILANDWIALPVAARAARRTGARIMLDLHEYAPLQISGSRSWMLLVAPMVEHYLRRYGPRVSGFVTVNETIANRYKDEFGFDVAVITNAPELTSDAPPPFRPTRRDQIRLVHHGAPSPDRKLEISIEAVAALDARFSLTFMFTDRDRSYVQKLRKLANRLAPGRISFEAAVPPLQVVPTISAYDIGLHIIPPTSFNYWVALPNKFFECVCAGLAVCVGPSPEMARLVKAYGFGAISSSFQPKEIANTLSRLTVEEIDAMKHRSLGARKELNATGEMDKLERLCNNVLASK